MHGDRQHGCFLNLAEEGGPVFRGDLADGLAGMGFGAALDDDRVVAGGGVVGVWEDVAGYDGLDVDEG